jgi:hypothetical protein
MPDDTIDTARDERMPGLNGDQSAEPTAEHKDRPDPQRTTGGEENDAKPANGISVEGPEPLPICVGRQIGRQKPDQPESCQDPAVGTILALARTQISAAEERYARQHEECDRKGNQCLVGKERLKPAPAKDSEPEIGKGPDHGDEC